MKFKIAIIILIILQAVCSYGQYKPVKFGQNRVQYKNFEWFYYGTDNYDIHFYALGEEYTKVALDVLDEEFEKITDMIGYAPFAKTKIFIYNSPTDLLQSNIGVGQPVFSIAGETKFIKLQMEVAYPGSIIEFRKELKYKLSLTLLNDMMFGGSLTDVFQSAYLLHLPEWFSEGAARYVAFGWDLKMDDYLRDYLTKKRIKNFSKLEGEQAALVGQSVWNYIAVRYGKSNLSNILNLTRIIRNEQNSIASSLGVSYEQFMYEWTDYYSSPMESINSNYIAPEKDERLVKVGGENKLTKLKISPDGSKLAYVQNFIGKYKVVIKDLETGKERVAHKGGYHIIDQEVSYDMPLIDWMNDSSIAIVEAWFGTNYLVTYDLKTRMKNRKSLIRFNQVNDISFNDNGKLAVISADVKGQTDLYLISMRRNAVKRLTKDPWDDLYPEFIPGTDAIVFSSNRTSDSLGLKPSKNSETPDLLNLYAYDLDTTENKLFRLTNTLSNDIRPVPFDKNNIYYLSDLKGINNMYRFSFSDSTFTQVTNFRTSLKEYDINQYTKDLSFLMLNKGKAKIYINQAYDLDRTVFTPPTLRHQVKQIEYMRDLRDDTSEDEWEEFDEEWNLLTADSLSNDEEEFAFGQTDDFEFILDEYNGLMDTTQREKSEFLDLDNYEFGSTEDEFFTGAESEPKPKIQAQMDDPLNFLFQDQILQRRDSLVGDSIGIRSLSYRHPSEFTFDEDLPMDSLTRDSLDALGINYRHPSGYEYMTDSTIKDHGSVSDAYFRHPPGYENIDYDDDDLVGNGTSDQSEFIDLENYRFGSVDSNDTGSFLSRVYNTSDPVRMGDGNFAVDTTLYQTPDGEYIDTEAYNFEDEAEVGDDDIFSFLSIYLKIQKEPEIIGPLPFETSFNIDHVVTSFALDQFRGFGILVETQMSDILENHKFNGGFMLNTDFHSGDFYAEYRYLKYTIDLKARFDRTVIFREGQELFNNQENLSYAQYTQKYKMNTYTLGAALPMSVSSRFEINGFMAFTEFYNLHPDVLAFPDTVSVIFDHVQRESHHTYGGINAAWVFDNTLSHGLNLFEGSRGKVQFEHYQCFSDNTKSFSSLNVDLRRYQKLHKELIFATRLYYARSFGNRPRNYMLGGMDNWIASENANEDQINTPLAFSNYKDNTDMLFAEFVNLRGFDYNRFSGTNVLALNAELRWPIIKYFTQGAIKSDFLRNLQFIGFYDIGSAWTGLSPFDENNTVDTRLIKAKGSPFEAVIKTTRNPWLQSYGFGIRTVLMGYYARFDFAKPIEDYEVGNMKFYVSIGYDF